MASHSLLTTTQLLFIILPISFFQISVRLVGDNHMYNLFPVTYMLTTQFTAPFFKAHFIYEPHKILNEKLPMVCKWLQVIRLSLHAYVMKINAEKQLTK